MKRTTLIFLLSLFALPVYAQSLKWSYETPLPGFQVVEASVNEYGNDGAGGSAWLIHYSGSSKQQLIWLSSAGNQILKSDLLDGGTIHLFRVIKSAVYVYISSNGTNAPVIRRFRVKNGSFETSDTPTAPPTYDDGIAGVFKPTLKQDPLGFFLFTYSTNNLGSVLIKRFSN